MRWGQGELLGCFISNAAACRSGSGDDTADSAAASAGGGGGGGANFFELPGLSCAACHFPAVWSGPAGEADAGPGERASRAEPRARGAPSPVEAAPHGRPASPAEAEAEAGALCVAGDLQGRVHFLRLRAGPLPARDPVDRIVARCCGHIAHFDW